jgi:hypothetical protein
MSIPSPSTFSSMSTPTTFLPSTALSTVHYPPSTVHCSLPTVVLSRVLLSTLYFSFLAMCRAAPLFFTFPRLPSFVFFTHHPFTGT